MTLEPLEILNGTFSLIFVIISIILGLIIISKYFHFKQRVFLLVGITWIGIVAPWYSSAISFLIALATGGDGLYSTPEIYLILGNVLVPIVVLVWLTAFTDLLYEEKQKLILIIFAIYGVIFEIIFFSLLIIDYTLIGELQGPVDVQYKSFVLIYLLSNVVVILITGILFARGSLKSDDPELKLKGKLLLFAFIAFSVGSLLDSGLTFDIITLVIARIILILSAVAFYGGFILPNWMRKLFLKQK